MKHLYGNIIASIDVETTGCISWAPRDRTNSRGALGQGPSGWRGTHSTPKSGLTSQKEWTPDHSRSAV